MYKFCMNPKTERGMIQLLLDKRNKQFAKLFKKLRDPVNILEFYFAIGEVYKKHFGDEEKAIDWTKVLMYARDRGYFWHSDLKEVLGLNTQQVDSVLKKMGKRHLLITDKSRHLHLYSLSAIGVLFLKDFKFLGVDILAAFDDLSNRACRIEIERFS